MPYRNDDPRLEEIFIELHRRQKERNIKKTKGK